MTTAKYVSKDKPSVLIVDDEPSSLKILYQILSSDYDILMARNGEEALDIAKTEDPDLILLDVIMNDMNGYDVLVKLKGLPETADIPVIFITGLSGAEDEEKGLLLGAADYITKPFLNVVVKARVYTQINNVKQRREIERLSMTDPLTGMPNRRCFYMRLSLAWGLAIRGNDAISLLFLDFDDLKGYNDKYRHIQGDIMIKSVADIIMSSAKRSDDLASRISGDEFAVLLPKTDIESAVGIAEMIRSDVESNCVVTGDGIQTNITVSIGVVTAFPEPGDMYEDFIALADTRLFIAKASGRNLVCASGGESGCARAAGADYDMRRAK